jgi:hypothetical protein
MPLKYCLYTWKNDLNQNGIISIDVADSNIMNIFELIKLNENCYKITRVLKLSHSKFTYDQIITIMPKSENNPESLYWSYDSLNNISEIDINNFTIQIMSSVNFYSSEIDKSAKNIIDKMNELKTRVNINNDNYEMINHLFEKII